MLTLMLLRHAKSDWDDPKMDDHDRPLSDRGRNDAPRMGKYLRSEKLELALVVCSTSVRTRETWDLVAPELKTKPKVRFERGVYLAAWPSLLTLVQQTPATVPSLMMIGHNPGFEQLAAVLSAPPRNTEERERQTSMAKKFPTCALAVLEFDGAWRDVKEGSGMLTDFTRPKDLDDG